MEISPFRAIRYNRRVVGDLAQVICPPYDVISPQRQALYYEKSSYNAIRLELPTEGAGPTADRYRSAAATFRRWLRDGIFRLDDLSGFYLHQHEFEYSGQRKVRCGLIARVRLEPWGQGIYPHEETGSKAKRDRLKLMRACRASFSPLLSLYHDSDGAVGAILSRVSRERSLVSFSDSEEAHTLWQLNGPADKEELSRLLGKVSLYIADGHHRYETALTYRQEMAKEQSSTAGEPFNYVMMELVDFSDQGLVVLPLHRLVRGVPPAVLAALTSQLRNLFTLQSVPLERGSPQLPADCCMGILGLQAGSMMILNRRQDVSLGAVMPDNRSDAYCEFGVSILNHIILDTILGGEDGLEIAYTIDSEEAYQQTFGNRQYQLAFLLPRAQPITVRAVADAGDRIPRKSTYFYPKVPAGLVFNSLE
jgi:uncharacterized protein (DUF1015 family)